MLEGTIKGKRQFILCKRTSSPKFQPATPPLFVLAATSWRILVWDVRSQRLFEFTGFPGKPLINEWICLDISKPQGSIGIDVFFVVANVNALFCRGVDRLDSILE